MRFAWNIVYSLFLAGSKEHLVFTKACFLTFSGLLLVDVTKKAESFHKKSPSYGGPASEGLEHL